MKQFYCKILNNINDLKEYRLFSYKTINTGNYHYHNGYVKDVKVISDSEVTANISSPQTYITTIKVSDISKILMTCSCPDDGFCEHESALVRYVKDKFLELETEYFVNTLDTPTFESASYFYYALRDLYCEFYDHSHKHKQLIQNLSLKLCEHIISIIGVKNPPTYQLYFNIFNLFQLDHQLLLSDYTLKENFFNIFFEFTHNPNVNILSYWKSSFPFNSIDESLNLIEKSCSFVDNSEKAIGLSLFIEATIEIIYKRQFDLTLSEKERYIYKLIFLKLKLLKEYETKETYISYFQKMSLNYNKVQREFILMLYNESLEKEILNFVEENPKCISTAKIIYNGIKYKNNSISYSDFKEQLLGDFNADCDIINFIYIKQMLTAEVFFELKDQLLKIAKKNNKYNYIEMEIHLDKEKGYQIAKEAGVIEFNKHHHHFIDEKYDEIIPYYQRELVEIISKLKGTGMKFSEVINVIEDLVTFKGGKYFAFSIYRMVKEKDLIQNHGTINALFHFALKLDL